MKIQYEKKKDEAVFNKLLKLFIIQGPALEKGKKHKELEECFQDESC